MNLRYFDDRQDPDLEARMAVLRDVGIGTDPDQQLDNLAARLAGEAGTRYAMVNVLSDTQQYFVGLSVNNAAQMPAHGDSSLEPGDPGTSAVGRSMTLNQGYCPHVVRRRNALVLDDVCDYPRFSSDDAQDQVGVRSYLGAPMIDPERGIVLGTVCAVHTDIRTWGQDGLSLIKAFAAEAAEVISRRLPPAGPELPPWQGR